MIFEFYRPTDAGFTAQKLGSTGLKIYRISPCFSQKLEDLAQTSKANRKSADLTVTSDVFRENFTPLLLVLQHEAAPPDLERERGGGRGG
jgi:hypothetical protein